jgi:aspartate aminotransferase
MIDYSYGKVLLAPGQRLGYLALSPLMPRQVRAELAGAFTTSQMALGWTFPNAVMQHAVPALEHLSIDIDALAAKRARVCDGLTGAGYRITRPEGTFYVWGEAPGGDAVAFCHRLKERDVRVMPGTVFDRPQHFRISLTASAEMIERAMPILEEAVQHA